MGAFLLEGGSGGELVAGGVVALVFAVAVVDPVFVEVAVGLEGAEFEDGFGCFGAPAGAGDVHAVFDQVAAGAFDDAGGDGPAVGQGCGVVQPGGLGVEVAGGLFRGLAVGRGEAGGVGGEVDAAGGVLVLEPPDLVFVPVGERDPGLLAAGVAAAGLVERGGYDVGG